MLRHTQKDVKDMVTDRDGILNAMDVVTHTERCHCHCDRQRGSFERCDTQKDVNDMVTGREWSINVVTHTNRSQRHCDI